MNRKEQIKGERRRRDAAGLKGQRKRLPINEAAMDPDFEYRFIKDNPSRVFQMTKQDDYDVVQDRDGIVCPGHAGEGSAPAYLSGTDANGQTERLVLVRKLKKYYNDDQAAKQARIDAKEAAMRDKPDGERQYTPDGRAVMTQDVDN